MSNFLAILVASGVIFTACGVILSALVSLRNRAALKELHLTLNSRLTEMLRLIAQSNQAIGRADEQRDAAAATTGSVVAMTAATAVTKPAAA